IQPSNLYQRSSNSSSSRPIPHTFCNASHRCYWRLSCCKRTDATDQCPSNYDTEGDEITMDKRSKKSFVHSKHFPMSYTSTLYEKGGQHMIDRFRFHAWKSSIRYNKDRLCKGEIVCHSHICKFEVDIR